jgi:addiction module antitoxin, RelB/DinJ family
MVNKEGVHIPKMTTNICIRIDAGLKERAEVLFNELGLSINTAVNVFLRQAVREGRIPFKVSMESTTRKQNSGTCKGK